MCQVSQPCIGHMCLLQVQSPKAGKAGQMRQAFTGDVRAVKVQILEVREVLEMYESCICHRASDQRDSAQ